MTFLGPPGSEDPHAEATDLPELEGHLEEAKKKKEDILAAQQEVDDLQKNYEEAKKKSMKLSNDDEVKVVNKKETAQPGASLPVNHLLRKEFKLYVSIGMPGQKEKLTYSSLARQIESGIARKYKDSEITDAVIRGISAELPLRSYLESTPDLTLPQLRSILRVHYNESTPQKLYKDLTTLVQQSKQDANQFLMHALEIRLKLMFASKEADADVTYDPILVQKLFLHSVETGLASQATRLRIRPVLENPNVTDEELIQAMRVAVSNEAERSNKLSAGKSTKVNLLQNSATGINDYPCSNKVSDHKINSEQPNTAKLLEATESLKSDVSNLKQEACAQRIGNNDNVKVNNLHFSLKPKTVCQQCKKEGKTDGCTHCFHCFSDEHWSKGRKKRERAWARETKRGSARGNP